MTDSTPRMTLRGEFLRAERHLARAIAAEAALDRVRGVTDRLATRLVEAQDGWDAARAELAAVKAERDRVRALADKWERIGRDGLPHLGCFDMHRHLSGVLRAALDGDEDAS